MEDDVDEDHKDDDVYCQEYLGLDEDDDFNDQSDIVVEMPPGAKPKTKHIFVAPLISFYGCVPYPPKVRPLWKYLDELRTAQLSNDANKKRASRKNQNL